MIVIDNRSIEKLYPLIFDPVISVDPEGVVNIQLISFLITFGSSLVIVKENETLPPTTPTIAERPVADTVGGTNTNKNKNCYDRHSFQKILSILSPLTFKQY